MDEQKLITELIAGNETAFRETVHAFHSPMTYVARAIVGPGSTADVVQDAWISVIKSLPQFERCSSLKTWVLSIVSNTAKSYLRKQGRIAMGDAQDIENVGLNHDRFLNDGHWANSPRAWDMNTPEHILGSEQLREQIFKTLGELPENQRAVLMLYDLEQLSFDEICNILEITDSNCRVLLHHARTRVWQAIEHLQTR